MAQSIERLLYLLLVTILLVSSIQTVRGFGSEELSSKIDADLFLEDEASGDGDDLERTGSGARGDHDDEDSIIDKSPYDPKSRAPGGGHSNNPDITFIETKDGLSPGGTGGSDNRIPSPPDGTHVFDPKHESTASFFSQPGILAAIICGAIVGLLCAILLVMFIVYRMRKKDEGSYVLEDSKRTTSSYGKTKEFYA